MNSVLTYLMISLISPCNRSLEIPIRKKKRNPITELHMQFCCWNKGTRAWRIKKYWCHQKYTEPLSFSLMSGWAVEGKAPFFDLNITNLLTGQRPHQRLTLYKGELIKKISHGFTPEPLGVATVTSNSFSWRSHRATCLAMTARDNEYLKGLNFLTRWREWAKS